jgi:hypothetical protein
VLSPTRSDLFGEPTGEAPDHRLSEVASPSVQFQLAECLLREGTFFHPGSHHGFANGFSTLHPDPVHGSPDEGARRLSSLLDLYSEIQKAQRTDRDTLEVDLVRQLEYASLGHP